jgi:hypothetical protein
LLLARERALLQDLELEVSHQMAEAISDIELNYALTQTFFSRRVAAEQEVEAVQARFEAGEITVDLLLDAQRRRAESETDYYRSLVDYNRAIMRVHYRKGSLLDYDGVQLAEGPWPGKAYFDAMRQARKRDAGLYLDYGYTRPDVFSRGPYEQNHSDGSQTGVPFEASEVGTAPDEVLPTPSEGENVTLPSPDASWPVMGPPANRTSSLPTSTRRSATYPTAARPENGGATRFTRDEHQANYASASSSPIAPIRNWGQR